MNDAIQPDTLEAPPLSVATGAPATPKITVAGVTFGADDVISAVVRLDGRKVHITEKESEPRKIGFTS